MVLIWTLSDSKTLLYVVLQKDTTWRTLLHVVSVQRTGCWTGGCSVFATLTLFLMVYICAKGNIASVSEFFSLRTFEYVMVKVYGTRRCSCCFDSRVWKVKKVEAQIMRTFWLSLFWFVINWQKSSASFIQVVVCFLKGATSVWQFLF